MSVLSLTLFVDFGDVTEPSLKTIKLLVTGQLQVVMSREHTVPNLDPHSFPFSGSLPSTNTNKVPSPLNAVSESCFRLHSAEEETGAGRSHIHVSLSWAGS